MLYLEYVWTGLENKIYSKVRILNEYSISLENIPIWNFDGSSTNHSNTDNSDIYLKPVKIYKHPFLDDKICSYLVLCECLNNDMTPHKINYRDQLIKLEEKYKDKKYLFGIEQEYAVFEKTVNNMLSPYGGYSYEQTGYCATNGNNVFKKMRDLVVEHTLLCIKAGIKIFGNNLEVANSSAEFQIGTCDMITCCDDLIMARFILYVLSEKYDAIISLHPKPFGDNYNGSGCHTNLSSEDMRNDIKYIYEACEKLKLKHGENNKFFGDYNELRLTGKHETSDINHFSYGVADRTATVRIPLSVFNDQKGYMEYRFPASNLEPYLGINKLITMIEE